MKNMTSLVQGLDKTWASRFKGHHLFSGCIPFRARALLQVPSFHDHLVDVAILGHWTEITSLLLPSGLGMMLAALSIP